MWPLLVFSIITTAIALERAVYLCYHNLRIDDLREKIEQYIEDADMEGAQAYLVPLTKRRMGARVLLTLVQRSNLSEYQMEKAVEAEARKCISSLENGFDFLTVLTSLAPLTGFLGTVSGMIGAFKSIAEATEVNAQIVAGGIYEALITTVFGLIIAVLATSAHSIFTHMVDTFVQQTDKNGIDLIIKIATTKQAKSSLGKTESETKAV
ncbi:MAG: MotA/TolQ/ExbB proton channel family protein [Spirochaetaceae bacterium]|nr:MotA/TolQ/ExbB proton channel family protein [Spirochaetaceae bacterium]